MAVGAYVGLVVAGGAATSGAWIGSGFRWPADPEKQYAPDAPVIHAARVLGAVAGAATLGAVGIPLGVLAGVVTTAAFAVNNAIHPRD